MSVPLGRYAETADAFGGTVRHHETAGAVRLELLRRTCPDAAPGPCTVPGGDLRAGDLA